MANIQYYDVILKPVISGESACNVGDLGSIPEFGRSPG